MASRRLLTTSIIGRGRVPSPFRYSNHLKSFRIPHSTLAASSGPSVPSGAERTVNIQLVLQSVLPERDADSLLNTGEPTRWMNVLMQSSAKPSTSISTYYEKSSAKPCTVKPNARVRGFRCHRKGSYHYESPTAPGLRHQLKRLWSAFQTLRHQLKRLCSKVVDFLQRQLLPWAWTTVVKVLEGVLVQYLSNNVGGAVWNKLWRALKTWMNW